MPPTVDTIAAIVARAEQRVTKHQRVIESLTGGIGRPVAFYVVLSLVVAWIGGNLVLEAVAHRSPLDQPPFFWLQGTVTLLSLVMTILILITANRQNRLAEERAHLDLQINLLTEQKVAKLIALVEELRRDLPMVRDRIDPEAESMQVAANPHEMLESQPSAATRAKPGK